MKKTIIKTSLIIIIIVFVVLFVNYIVNYKNFEEIVSLLEKGTQINNVYAERYVDYAEYYPNTNVKSFKVDIYWKDNILVYNDLDIIIYSNFNTNEFLGFSKENIADNPLEITDKPSKFNEYITSDDIQDKSYKYLFSWFYDNTWCDIIQLYTNEYKQIYYIDQSTGLVLKTIIVNNDNKKDIATYKYQFDIVTNEQIQNPPIV